GIKAPDLLNCSVEVPFQYESSVVDIPRLAVICHMFHAELANQVRHYLHNIPFRFDVFISTDTTSKQTSILNAFADWTKGRVEVHFVENRGRDIAPKLVNFRHVYDDYDYVLHLHTKKSHHTSHLSGWRGFLFETLLGSPAIVMSVFESFVL